MITGCDKKDKLILDCNMTLNDVNETIRIRFYNSDKAIKTVTVPFDPKASKEDIKRRNEFLTQNYCNNQIKEDYSCELGQTRESIILTEKGKSRVIMGETKEIGVDQYKKNIEEKGFKCQYTEK